MKQYKDVFNNENGFFINLLNLYESFFTEIFDDYESSELNEIATTLDDMIIERYGFRFVVSVYDNNPLSAIKSWYLSKSKEIVQTKNDIDDFLKSDVGNVEKRTQNINRGNTRNETNQNKTNSFDSEIASDTESAINETIGSENETLIEKIERFGNDYIKSYKEKMRFMANSFVDVLLDSVVEYTTLNVL